MEACYKCACDADYVCPDCGSRICKAHMEPRYPGPHHKNFTSNFMCPVCWLVRRVMLEENMLKIEKDGSLRSAERLPGEKPSIFPVRHVKCS